MGERNREQTTQVLLLTMADTAWRMFVPPTITVAIGLWADNAWHTGPWLTLMAAAAGLGGSILLIKRQLEGTE